MSGIFICYRREDSAPYAGRLYDRISVHFSQEQVFMDIDAIKPGEDFVEVLEKKVESCNVLIALIGRQWLTCTDDEGRRRLDNPDDFVRLEIAAAVNRKIRVIPILVGGASMPRSQDLPDALRALTRRQAVEISDLRFHQDVNQLIESLERTVAVAEDLKAGPETPQPLVSSVPLATPAVPTAQESLVPTYASSPLIPRYKLKQTLSQQGGSVLSMAFSPDERWLASAGGDGCVRFWDTATGENSQTLKGHGAAVCSLRFSPSGHVLASGGIDRKILLWDVATEAVQQTLTGHTKAILALSFHPDETRLVSAGYDDTIRLWDLSNNVCSQQWNSRQRVVHAVMFSPDGRLVASAGADNTIKLWEASTGNLVQSLVGHINSVYCLCFSPDGHLLGSGSRDAGIKLWDTESWKPVQVLRQHRHVVLCLSFTSDGGILASGSADNTIKLWDPVTGMMVCNIDSHQPGVQVMDFSSDGGVLASGAADGTIKLWERLRVRSSVRFLKESES